ncbi:MAG: hypothetical protein ACLPKI_31800 [Streptosporangiaceae bacterium]
MRCPRDEITWLDRALLSGNRDLTLHRSPRCAGLRYVHHRWELFSRDSSYPVYLACYPGSAPMDARGVQEAARHVLPVAPALHYETLPVVLEAGTWLVSVGNWVLPLRLDISVPGGPGPAEPGQDEQPVTQEKPVRPDGGPARRGSPPRPDAAQRVRVYFQRNVAARMAMAFHYQEYILGRPAPQPVPMMDVVVALDLSGEGAVSDYKKLLQGLIWKEAGHQRELAEFLLRGGLLTLADLNQARKVAEDNERTGRSEQARRRLKYRPKKQ